MTNTLFNKPRPPATYRSHFWWLAAAVGLGIAGFYWATNDLPAATKASLMIERERAMVDAPNVTPLREPEPIPAQASIEPEQQQLAANGGQSAEEMAQTGFESPFEDELDTPAFLRKRTTGGDDSDAPPFMRRGGS